MNDELEYTVLPEDEGKQLVEQTPDTEALWLKPDGTAIRSSGFAALEKRE